MAGAWSKQLNEEPGIIGVGEREGKGKLKGLHNNTIQSVL